MRTFVKTTAASLLLVAHPALAQTPPAAAPAPRPALTGKRLECMNAGKQQNLKGPDLYDSVQVCLEEARLACLKQAIAQKTLPSGRPDFIKTCLG